MQKAIISRKDAYQRGLTHFYTGKLCKHGHDSGRFVSNGCCCMCTSWQSNRAVPMNDPRAFKFTKALLIDDRYQRYMGPQFVEMMWQCLFNEADAMAFLCERAVARLNRQEPLSLTNIQPTAKMGVVPIEAYLESGWTVEQLYDKGYVERRPAPGEDPTNPEMKKLPDSPDLSHLTPWKKAP